MDIFWDVWVYFRPRAWHSDTPPSPAGWRLIRSWFKFVRTGARVEPRDEWWAGWAVVRIAIGRETRISSPRQRRRRDRVEQRRVSVAGLGERPGRVGELLRVELAQLRQPAPPPPRSRRAAASAQGHTLLCPTVCLYLPLPSLSKVTSFFAFEVYYINSRYRTA
eukprot:scaffold48435_cov68-Phaeocystis_antarctica.AAC.1